MSTRVVRHQGDTHYAQEADATLCEEYLDPTASVYGPLQDDDIDGWGETSETVVTCVLCLAEARVQVTEYSRAFVARELGVDISEVF
jgi:hypothetical protein